MGGQSKRTRTRVRARLQGRGNAPLVGRGVTQVLSRVGHRLRRVGNRRVWRRPMKDIEKFKEDIQKILDKFQFDGETRRKFFSLLVEYAEEQQAGNPKKGNQNG